ncbi:MAG: histidine kinase [Bacteroidales bacterium]|nr:histidine kinase [Bacteroidales bacterium]
MKAPALYDFMNLRKPVSHITFLIFSLLVTIITAFTGKYSGPPPVSFSIFILIFAQLEVFIYFGNRLFADLNFGKSPGEITRIILVRFMIFLTACLMVSMILFILSQYAGLWIKGEDLSKVISNFFHYEIRGWFKSTITGLSVGGIIFIVLLWQSSLRREQKLREENLIFQNETLKNQVNPHFLFNSLNTLSALVNTQPDVAEEFINRLSSIYRYILENSSKDRVPLGVELSFIRDYFFLHKIRDDGKIQLEVKVNETDNSEILPVSLQILVENAIKHNKATRESPLKISIYIENKHVIVKNNLQKMAVQLKSTKIGLKNLAQRVRLMTGKVLIIEETNTDFIVKIPLL